MDDHTKDPAEIDESTLARILIPGTMSGAEMLEFWEDNGVFDVPWSQYDDIGPGRKYADSTEYVNAQREQIAEEWLQRHHG